MEKTVISKIDFFIENYIPYESKGNIEPIKEGYRVAVSFYDTILGKQVNEFLYFTRDGEIIKN